MTLTRPNILFIQVDQLAAEHLRCYGNGWCHAPNLDALAARGTVFDTAYCNFPLCSPSRASMATGQLCSRIGAYDNAAELPACIPTYAHYLRAEGYHTALSGKMHFIGPDQHHGFDARLTPDLYPADFAWVPNWGDEGERDTNDARSVTVSGVCARSTQIDFDDLVAREAVQHIYDRARQGGNQPFFLQVSFTHPHEPYLCQQEYWDLYEGVDIPPPQTGKLGPDQHDAHSRRTLEDFGMLDAPWTDADVARARRAFFGAISYLDAKVGEVLDALTRSGQADNTVIVFAADHGEMLGERGMWFKKSFYEPSIRVPLMIAGAGFDARRVATPVSLVDLLPTFMGLAIGSVWTSPVEPLDGVDLRSLLTAEQPDRGIYAEYLAEATTAPILMIRRGPYKYVHAAGDPAQLCDVVADPLERENLAERAEFADLVAAFQVEVSENWDEAALTDAILLSQRRRALVKDAHAQGQMPRWNHGEAPGEKTRWYRGEGGYNEWAFDYLPPT